MSTAIDTIKSAISTIITNGGNLITKSTHTEANSAMIDALYYQDWGIPKPWFGATAPANHKLCDGTAVLIEDCNPAFVTAMHDAGFDTGGISITLPYIYPGDSLIQAGGAYVLNVRGGESTHTLSVAEMAAHKHYIFANHNGTTLTSVINWSEKSVAVESTSPNSSDYPKYNMQSGYDGSISPDATMGVTSSIGSGTPHNNMPPYYPINYIIRYA